MDGKGTAALIAAGAVGIWAFLSLTQTHDDERREIRAQVERDAAEIDSDFAKMIGDSADRQKELTARADAATKRLDEVKREVEERRKAEEAKRSEIQAAYEQSGGKPVAGKFQNLDKELSK